MFLDLASCLPLYSIYQGRQRLLFLEKVHSLLSTVVQYRLGKQNRLCFCRIAQTVLGVPRPWREKNNRRLSMEAEHLNKS